MVKSTVVSGHPARFVGSHQDRHVGDLFERHESSRVDHRNLVFQHLLWFLSGARLVTPSHLTS